ncbi:MAG: phosphoribosylglycinamide formyltransferase [Beijerinckiaceae bacterium]
MTARADQAQRKRVAVLISGRGSNMSALIDATRNPDYPAEIALVISNKPDAAGLEIARKHCIATLSFSQKAFETRDAFDQAIHKALQDKSIELVALAGFMRILTPRFCQQWLGRMINIHPSLLPAFKGLDTHRQVLAAGAREHGCSVHFVTPELDDGPVILQASIAVLPDDDEESLAASVLAEEHRIYPEALAMLADGRCDIMREALSRMALVSPQ